MKAWSKFFDAIRVKPLRPTADPEHYCEWEGCHEPATHPAPKNPQDLRSYRWFCLDHVRVYNREWDFFRGMSDEEIAVYQREAVTGHRPTWKLGEKSAGPAPHSRRWRDDFGFFAESNRGKQDRQNGEGAPEIRRSLPRALKRALETLGLDEKASLNDIKSRYKELVKMHHPDANGGDRSAEGRLRDVIVAYQQLRKSSLMRDPR
jgi:curved DNA-binding protein CbpA